MCQVPTSTDEEDEEIEQVLNEEIDLASNGANENASVVESDSHNTADVSDNGENLS